MNNEKNSQPVDLDSLIGDNHLQMMKAALPYMSVTEQRFISLFVKFNELRRTVQLFEDEEVAAMGICSRALSWQAQYPTRFPDPWSRIPSPRKIRPGRRRHRLRTAPAGRSGACPSIRSKILFLRNSSPGWRPCSL